MKSKYILSMALIALLATGCNQTTSSTKPTTTPSNSVASTNSNKSETSNTPSNSTKPSDSTTPSIPSAPSESKPSTPSTPSTPSIPSTPSTPVVKTLDLSEVKLGFVSHTTLTEDDKFDVYEVGVGDKAVYFKDYSASDERTLGWNSTKLTNSLANQIFYEPVSKDGKEYFGRTYYNLKGEAQHMVLPVYDSVVGEMVDTEWQYMDLGNFFENLEASDFTLQDDGTYLLNFKNGRSDDEVTTLKNTINHFLYPGIAKASRFGSNFGKLEKLDVLSFSLTVDEDLKPTGFKASLEDEPDQYGYGGDTVRSFEGTFTTVGADAVKPLADKTNTDSAFEDVLTKLRNGNYKFQATKIIVGEGYSWSPSTILAFAGSSDGTSISYHGQNGTAVVEYSYTNVDATHYQQFDGSKFVGDPIEGDLFGDFMPSFDFGSAAFDKISTAANGSKTDVYTIGANEFYYDAAKDNSNLYSSIFTPKFLTGYASSLSSTLKVTVSDDEIHFNIQDSSDPRIIDVRFYGFGSVDTIEVPLVEAAE